MMVEHEGMKKMRRVPVDEPVVNVDEPEADFNEATDEGDVFNVDAVTGGRVRTNIYVSEENLRYLRWKAQHSGTVISMLMSLAVSDYCDRDRLLYKELKK